MTFTYKKIGSNKYRLDRLNVFFNDLLCLNTINKVLDHNGNIINFPGIEKDERLLSELKIGIAYDVRFESHFLNINNKIIMLWEIQPNGWYWVDDDGFGFTNDKSIFLYSIINEDGQFKHLFKLYSIDQTQYIQLSNI